MTSNLMMNYWNGEWHRAAGSDLLDVLNPATQEVLGEVPLSRADAVAQAAEAAQAALPDWRRMPPQTAPSTSTTCKDCWKSTGTSSPV